MRKTSNVVARLTAAHHTGRRIIIEVHEDASFHQFFRYYAQDGNRRSTKKEMRRASRNEGLRPAQRAPWMRPGLDVLAKDLQTAHPWRPACTDVRIRILKKRLYRRLLEARPDELGLVRVERTWVDLPRPRPVLRIPIRLPAGHTPLKKRFEIMTGRG